MAATAPLSDRPTWLCPDAASRERMLDMDERLRRPRAMALAIVGLVLLPAIHQFGWLPLALLVGLIAAFGLVARVQPRMARPEYAVAASWALSQIFIAVAIAMTGGVDSYAVGWLAIPLITLPSRFGVRVVGVGVAFSALLLGIIALFVEPTHDVPEFFGVLYPAAALMGVAILSTALLRSDLDHRNEAVVDGLTGMLNRRSLRERLAELEAQAAHTRQPIAVVAGDLDHFKQVNDQRGHAAGDAVLVDVATRIRGRLRAFDLAYRTGGEEFLVVLPGASTEQAAAIAESLRAAIEDEPVAGVPVTMSFGVAGSDAEAFDSGAVLAAADDALYAAKDRGRNAVVVADAPALA